MKKESSDRTVKLSYCCTYDKGIFWSQGEVVILLYIW